MAKLEQKSIEQYFQEFKVSEKVKEKLLLKITNIIYERNMLVVKQEAETDAYKKKQLAREVNELETKIGEIIKAN